MKTTENQKKVRDHISQLVQKEAGYADQMILKNKDVEDIKSRKSEKFIGSSNIDGKIYEVYSISIDDNIVDGVVVSNGIIEDSNMGVEGLEELKRQTDEA